MNIALRAVKYTPENWNTVTLDTMTVRGSTVRYIILPDSLPLDTLLIDDAPKPKNKARKEAERGGRGGGMVKYMLVDSYELAEWRINSLKWSTLGLIGGFYVIEQVSKTVTSFIG